MVGKPFDLALHAVDPENVAYLVVREDLDEGAGEEDHAGAAEHYRGHGKAAQPGGVERVDFAVADREDGHRDHVGGIAQRPALGHETGSGKNVDRQDECGSAGQILHRRAEHATGGVVYPVVLAGH